MTVAILQSGESRMVVDLSPLAQLSEADFVALCAANPELRLERGPQGEIVIVPPEGGESGYRVQAIGAMLYNWAVANGEGIVFGSSTGFQLPDGLTRSPDAAWVRRERLAALSVEEKRRFLPLAPDFVIEVRSPTDRPSDLEAKMLAYTEAGERLGWFIDPESRTVQVYRPGQLVERVVEPASIAADPELPGFVLDLANVWRPDF